jgi:hypothetical protein
MEMCKRTGSRVTRFGFLNKKIKYSLSEHPLVKHGLKTSRIVRSKDKSWLIKLREILIEILIIVFAVSITLLLEHWREYKHDRQLENEFLTELKDDIETKMRELKGDEKGFNGVRRQLQYLFKTSRSENPYNKDSVDIYLVQMINSYYYLNPNSSIFESIKYSGKFGVIKNKELRAALMKLYQEDFPALQIILERFYFPALSNMKQFVSENKIVNKGQNNLAEILMTKPEFGNVLEDLDDGYSKMGNRYRVIIKTNEDVLEKIKKELQ